MQSLLSGWSLKVKQVRELYNERPVPNLRDLSIPSVAVYQIDVAQRMVRPVKTNIRTDLMSARIVLNERIEKCAGCKRVKKTRSNEVCRE